MKERPSLSPYLFNICFCNIYVSIHFLKVLLGSVSLFAIPLKTSFTLKAEEDGCGKVIFNETMRFL